MARLAIKGHKTRGKEVIALLEMLGGKNEHYLAGCEPGDYYHIIKGGAINNGYVYPEGFAIFTLEEFEKEFPYKVGDKVDCRMFGIRSVTRMNWNSTIEQILYSVKNEENECDVMIACAKDLRPYNPESVETSPDKAKAPALEGEDYSEGRCGYKIPEGFEFDKVENGKIILKPKKKALPKTYEECCEVLRFSSEGDIVYSGKWVYGYAYLGQHLKSLRSFSKLLICRDAYWKLADDWKPCWNGYNGDSGLKYCIFQHGASLMRGNTTSRGCILMFPTAEMRDTFYENFENLIWECEELL